MPPPDIWMGLPEPGDAPPTRRAGENYEQYKKRVEDWKRRHPGEMPSSGQGDLGLLPAGHMDLPSPTQRFPQTGSGERLGDFDLPPAQDLPPPAVQVPDEMRPPPSSTSLFRGPAGAILPGLRTPWGAVGPDRTRPFGFSATGFDPAWGTPPRREGLSWNPDRDLYEPSSEDSRHLYDLFARDGRFVQAYQDDDLQPGAWLYRWVQVSTPLPDIGQPYVLLGPAEDLYAQFRKDIADRNREAYERLKAQYAEPTAQLVGPGPARSIDEIPEAVLRYAQETAPRQANLADFAWIAQRDLPVGCPYPYPYLPVPQADYASGRWLDNDYTPSIPLPPPFDLTPWRCGLPPTEEKPKKHADSQLYENIIKGSHAMAGYTVPAFDVGLPPPTGSAAPPPKEDISTQITKANSKIDQLNKEAAKLQTKILKATTSAEKAKLQKDLDGLRDKAQALKAEAEAQKKEYLRQHPDETISIPHIIDVGIPPPQGLAADEPPSPPPPAPPAPPTPPRTRKRTRADICKIAEKAAASAKKLSRHAKGTFLQVQADILRQLCAPTSPVGKKDGKDDPDAVDWLARTLEVFEGSLENHLAGSRHEEGDLDKFWKDKTFQDKVLNELVAGTAAGPWWDDLDKTIDKLNRGVAQSGGGGPGLDTYTAIAMFVRHIDYDLRFALETQGVGRDGDWKELGKAVKSSIETVIGPAAQFLRLVEVTGMPDPLKMRDEVRDEEREALDRADRGPGGQAKDHTFSGTKTKGPVPATEGK